MVRRAGSLLLLACGSASGAAVKASTLLPQSHAYAGGSAATILAGSAGSSIPLSLFQTDVSKPDDDYIASWTAVSPGLEYVFMNDCDGSNYLRASWGERYSTAFNSIAAGAIKADFLRLCYIAEHGGFYVDTDNCAGDISLTRLREHANEKNHSLIYVKSVDDGRVFNAFFGAVARHPLVEEAARASLARIEARYAESATADPTMVMEIAGPKAREVTIWLNQEHAMMLDEIPKGAVSDASTLMKVATNCKTNVGSPTHFIQMATTKSVYHPAGQVADACLHMTITPPEQQQQLPKLPQEQQQQLPQPQPQQQQQQQREKPPAPVLTTTVTTTTTTVATPKQQQGASKATQPTQPTQQDQDGEQRVFKRDEGQQLTPAMPAKQQQEAKVGEQEYPQAFPRKQEEGKLEEKPKQQEEKLPLPWQREEQLPRESKESLPVDVVADGPPNAFDPRGSPNAKPECQNVCNSMGCPAGWFPTIDNPTCSCFCSDHKGKYMGKATAMATLVGNVGHVSNATLEITKKRDA